MLASAKPPLASGAFHSPVYAFYLAHVTLLVRELNPRLDAQYTAGALLGGLGAEQVHVWREQQAMDHERIAAGFRTLVEELSAG